MRIAGYLCFAAADSAAMLLLGACLTGIGGALYSSCMEALAASIDAQPDGNPRYLARDAAGLRWAGCPSQAIRPYLA